MMAYWPLRRPSFPPVPQAVDPSKMVNVSASDLTGFVKDTAEIVGVLSGAVGTLAGGVYVTLYGFADESVPHAGEQGVPLAVNVQVTPALAGSFWTVALNWA